MKISILCIGDELLKGATVNTNLASIGQKLLEIGLIPVREVTAMDDRNSLFEALEFLLPVSDVIVTVGGLGPTMDDVTVNIVADFFNRKLVMNEAVAENIRKMYSRLRRGEPSERIMSQAMIPEGAEVMENTNGSAPGILLKIPGEPQNGDDKIVMMLPGPPREALPILEKSVIPYLNEINHERIYTEVLHTVGLPESIAEEQIIPLVENNPDLKVAYCASPEGLRIFLQSVNEKDVSEKSEEIRQLLATYMLSEGVSLVEDVSIRLRNLKYHLATAESCTGGMIAAAITDLPGSSDVFSGSLVVYSNDAKNKLLGVQLDTLKKHGAVSDQCVREMVENVCERFEADTGIAVTGIAGPGGGSEEKPVGLVFIGVKCKDKICVKKCNFPGDRYKVRRRTVSTALDMLRKELMKIGEESNR